ncbi:MAG: hypothetical protein K6A70_09745 [Erysipelotrichaceae bacterium]|nr:hypothetical protein [Erysipelotrichaceae bacterium]
MKQDETRKIHYIPENYATGINVAGMNFKVRNFIEGLIVSLLSALICVLILYKIPFIDFGTKIGFIISFALMGLLLGIIGINDEALSVFVSNKLRFDRRKRTAFYNPRIKEETIPYIYEYRNNRESLPKEKIVAFYKAYKASIEKREQEKMREFQKTNTFDETSMFFEDDEGIVVKPVEYMNPSEYRKYQREVKRRKRMEAREARRIEKQKRRQKKGRG